MKRIIVSLVCLLLLGAGCQSDVVQPQGQDKITETDQVTEGFKRYKEEANNFSFEYPSDWTSKKSAEGDTARVDFYDADGEFVMLAMSPSAYGTGVGDIFFKELTVTAKDMTAIKISLLRTCAEYDTFDENQCVFPTEGFSGTALWKDVRFEFSSNKVNSSPEEQKMVEMFESILKSVATTK